MSMETDILDRIISSHGISTADLKDAFEGEYYIGKVSTGFCVSMDMPNGRAAFIGNGSTLDEAKSVAEKFDRSNERLTA